jgi:tRNA A-37 threonylcarbamoyl transferase component Bud32
MTLKSGDTVEGRYKIIKELDKGGMGSVFLAEHQLIKRRVALKLLRADLAEDADVLERFMNEARAAGTLGHPNIVESTDMGFTREGVPYIVFEFLEGSLLTDEIYRVHGLPVRRALRIARQIASALHAAHTAGVIHRDLKSDNIFLTDRDEAADHVKVLDFGISRFLDSEDNPKSRAMVVGTPQFMAPEQITSPELVDQRTDIYALGVILYEMLTARRPFEDDDGTDALLPRIVQDPPAALGIADLPPGLETMLFERFLAKRPDDRFTTMKDVESALAAFAGIVRPPGRDSQPIMVTMPEGTPVPSAEGTPVPMPAAMISLPPAPRRSNPLWLAAAVLVAGAGAGSFAIEPKQSAAATDPNLVLLRGDGDKLGASIEATMRAAQLRVDGIAQSPMLRAGIETDTATVQDMFKNELSLKLDAGEVFELLQIHEESPVLILRVPPGKPVPTRADNQPRLAAMGAKVSLVVSTPVTTQRGGVAGAAALQVPIDLTGVATQIGARASGVTLKGLGPPIPLGPPAAGPGTPVEVPISLPKQLDTTITLAAVLPPVPVVTSPFGYIRLACWALAGILGIGYLISLLRSRRRV